MITIENEQVGTIKADTTEELLAILKYLKDEETKLCATSTKRKRTPKRKEVKHSTGWVTCNGYQSGATPRPGTQTERILKTVATMQPINAQDIAEVMNIAQSSVCPTLTDLYDYGYLMRRKHNGTYAYAIRLEEYK